MVSDTLTLHRDGHAAFIRGDMDHLDNLFADDLLWHMAANSQSDAVIGTSAGLARATASIFRGESQLVRITVAVVCLAGCAAPLDGAVQAGESPKSPPCTIEIAVPVTLGAFEDPASIEIPVDADVAAAPWGGWIVAEDAKDVLEYGPSGRFVRFLGRRGEGPNELRFPSALALDGSDSLWISDPRGRVVIFGPDGVAARTVTTPALYQVQGFTPSGYPYAVLARGVIRPEGAEAWDFAQVWTRNGVELYAVGPAVTDPEAEGAVANLASPPQGFAVADSVFLVPRGWESWITEWTPSSVTGRLPAQAVWSALGLAGSPSSWWDGRPIALRDDGEGGLWILGVIRRLSRTAEERMVEAMPPVAGESLPWFRRNSPSVSNAVYDGVLVHVARGDTITAAVSFEDFPRGFAGNAFYTFTEDLSGLVQARLWSFAEKC